MNKTHYAVLLAGCSLLSLPGAALAQEATESSEEIVVTANKREQALQDVALAVTVVDDEQLARLNIDNTADLSRAVPSINVVPAIAGGARIRGIGTSSFSRSAEGSVGYVIDEVPYANAAPQGIGLALFDVERVEVLEGPQGMLFGRSASAGVLNIVTREPQLNEWDARVHLDYTDQESGSAQAMINAPLGDEAALRVVLGYSEPLTNTENFDGRSEENTLQSGRARLLVRPTSNLDINIIADYQVRDFEMNTWALRNVTPFSPLSFLLAGCPTPVTPSDDNVNTCIDGPSFGTSESWGLSGQFDYDFNGYTFTSVSAVRAYSDDSGGDSDSLPINILNTNTTASEIYDWSQEFRLASPTGGFFEYVAGVYMFTNTIDSAGGQGGGPNLLLAIPYGSSFDTSIEGSSYALFGQGTFNVSEDLRLIAGLRLNHDELEARTTRALLPGALATFPPGGSLATTEASTEEDSVSYRLGVQYDFNEDVMAYVTYSQGYKGPAINDQALPTVDLVIDPEVPLSWEVGLKAFAFDRAIAIDISAFHTEVQDFQTQVFDAGAIAFVFANAPSLTTQGVSANVYGQIGDNFTFNVGGIYTDATFGDNYLVACAPSQTADPSCVGGLYDASGENLNATPEWKANIGGEYSWQLASNFQGYVQADAVYTSEIDYSIAYDPETVVDSQVLVGGRIGVRGENWGVSIFGRNLTDEHTPAIIFADPVSTALGLDPGAHSQLWGPESRRTVGIALDYNF